MMSQEHDTKNESNPTPSVASSAANKKSGTSAFGKAAIWLVALVVIIAICITGYIYYEHSLAWESTDDAFIAGHINRVSPRVDGYVEAIHVKDNMHVTQGQLLVELNNEDFIARVAADQAALASAQANSQAAEAQLKLMQATTAADLAEAQSHIELAKAGVATAQANVASAASDAQSQQADLARYQKLLESESVTAQQFEHTRLATASAAAHLKAVQQQVNQAKAQLQADQAKLAAAQAGVHRVDVAQANVATAQAMILQAKANLQQSQLNLSHTKITSPMDGYVTRKAIEPGQYVKQGQPVLAIVPADVWVVANFKETQLSQIRVGQPVEIYIDAYPDAKFQGHVQSIQRGTGAAFSLLPPQNATGNYVKVVQRVPVKITFDKLPDPKRYVLAAGMSVVPEVHVKPPPRDEQN